MKRFACALLCLLAWPVLAQNAVGSLPPAQLSAAEESEVDAMVLPVPGAWIGDLEGMRASRTVRILVPFSKTFYQVIAAARKAWSTSTARLSRSGSISTSAGPEGAALAGDVHPHGAP